MMKEGFLAEGARHGRGELIARVILLLLAHVGCISLVFATYMALF